MRINIKIPSRKPSIQNRYELFDKLRTGWKNPDYSCIEIYWEILRPISCKKKGAITLSNQQISNMLAPQHKNAYYYSTPTIKRKLFKLQEQGLIVISQAWREKAITDLVPIYYFTIMVL